MLNRAPTLHRLGIQAFEPKLIEVRPSNCIRLFAPRSMPISMATKMAVHVPLLARGATRTRVLMMSTNIILHPANGQPIIVPSQDIVLGLYYVR